MKFEARVACLLLLLLLNCGGCSYLHHAAVNLVSAPVNQINEHIFLCKLHCLARAALVEAEKLEGKKYSRAYAHGFEHGFVDYIDCNGGGVPPAIPPYHLQRAALRNPDQQDAMIDWFAGFRHGARMGQESGLRERILVPIALPPQRSNESTAPEPAMPLPMPTPERPTPLTMPQLGSPLFNAGGD